MKVFKGCYHKKYLLNMLQEYLNDFTLSNLAFEENKCN